MVKLIFSALLTIPLSCIQSKAQFLNPGQQAYSWADSVLNTMSNEQKIGQLFMVPAYSSGNEQHHHAIEQLISNYHVGGLIFMEGGPGRQARLTNRFQRKALIPLLIGMDMEWGLGMRLDSTMTFPKPMTLGAIQDNSLIYNMSSEVARQLKKIGVHVAFGPVVDISRGLLNPNLGERSFGEKTAVVTKKATAYMNGMHESDILVVAKHFQGHTDAQTLSPPILTTSREVLENRDLVPLKELIKAGLGGILTGHLYLPDVSDKERLPSTLSTNVVSGFLKNTLGFEGLVFTDAMNTKAISNKFPNGDAEVLAFKAGNDILLSSTQVPLAVKKIKRAIKKEPELVTQLDNSVRKILAVKYNLTLNKSESLITDNLSLYLNQEGAHALRHKLYSRAVVALKNKNGALPITKLDNTYFASLTFGEGLTFENTLSNYSIVAHYQYDQESENILLQQIRNYDYVVIGVFQTPTNEALDFLKKLAQETTLILCHAGSSHTLDALATFPNLLHVEENNNTTQLLLAEACFGGIDISGKLAVTTGGAFKSGYGLPLDQIGRLTYDYPENVQMSSKVLSKIDNILDEAVEDGATPGGQVIVARKGKIIYENNFGYYTYDKVKPVTAETIYDIASITKVAATLQAFMFLHERGEIDLEKKLSVYLPELKGTNKENMILMDILSHQAGLWPYLPFWKQTLKDSGSIENFYSINKDTEFQYQVAPGLYAAKVVKDSVWNWVKNSKLLNKGKRKPYSYRYSDMGYYLLQRLIEKNLNQSMEEFLQQNFYEPLGLSSCGYLPLCSFPLSRIAPTEDDNYFRNSLVYGLVHDQGAALIGGVAGHAGLFSNARDLAKLMQMHLQGGTYGKHRFLNPGTIGLFTKQQYTSNRRGLGWDKPVHAKWYGPASRFVSAKTFGHTGFTGTAAWVDPEFDLVYIFLSNRIHPDASNRKLIQNNIRTRIQDVIYESIWDHAQYGSAY